MRAGIVGAKHVCAHDYAIVHDKSDIPIDAHAVADLAARWRQHG